MGGRLKAFSLFEGSTCGQTLFHHPPSTNAVRHPSQCAPTPRPSHRGRVLRVLHHRGSHKHLNFQADRAKTNAGYHKSKAWGIHSTLGACQVKIHPFWSCAASLRRKWYDVNILTLVYYQEVVVGEPDHTDTGTVCNSTDTDISESSSEKKQYKR